MKKITLTLIFTVLSLSIFAQITHTKDGSVDQNAEKILKKAAQKINDGTVSFSVTMTNKNPEKKITAKMEANVLYYKGKYRVSFDDNVVYCNGNEIQHWNKGTNELVINNMSEDDDNLMNPANLLANYSKNYKAKFIRQETNGNAVIDLTPKKTKSYYKIRLIINANNGIIQNMEMHNYDSSCGEYKVTNFKGGLKYNESDYTFSKSKNPGVEVIDMR
ncbi:MAG: outer membrane lipoprotein carrier protein LolA [Bacteroidales bacterium]|nr:outer membrane lipoprotein carrier protein LolA [Bacteroidales bacterium]